MHPTPVWNLDPTCILTRRELAAVLADLPRGEGGAGAVVAILHNYG